MFQNRLDIYSSGSQVPVVPELPRSARGKRSVRKKVEDHQTCAIDLLANLASKLLSETEGFQNPYHTANGTVKQVLIEKENLSKFEASDQLSCSEDVLRAQDFLKRQILDYSKDHSDASKVTSPGHASLLVKSDISDEDAIGVESEFVGHNCKIGSGMHVDEKYGKERLHDSYIELNEYKELKSKTTLQAQEQISRDSKVRKPSYIDDLENLNANSPSSGISDSSIEVPLHRIGIPHNGFFHKKEDVMNLAVHKYNDDNCSGCTHSTNINSKSSRLQHNADYHRIKKVLASKFRKVAPRVVKDGDTNNHDVEKKPALQSKRMCYTSQKAQRRSFKRRKFFERYSESAHEGGIYHQGLSDLFKKGGIKLGTNGSHDSPYRGNGAWSCRTDAKPSYSSPDYHVKLSIKSFTVPELLIEIPETATVGYLKKTVMDAVTSILVGGLRVGVLLQGNKVTDDSKTLHQAGISEGDKLDSLGFILEPNSRQTPMKLASSKDPHSLSLGCASEEPSRFPSVAPTIDQWRSDDRPQPVQTHSKSDYNVAHPPIDTSSPEKVTTDSLALVAVPPNNLEELAMVSLHNKSKTKRSEVVQRRVRRPFSVDEVQALVQAVEKLGTGRWRDVKLCAFENAKHRTYVDLKDKWKTLVHTAKISPQQRRGEPVPQELLDRVLSAHDFWSQHQAKLQVKQPPPAATTCIPSYPIDCKPTDSCSNEKKEENMNVNVE